MSLFSTAKATIRRATYWFSGCTLGRRIRCIRNIIPPSRFYWIALCKKDSRITNRLVHGERTVVVNFGGLNRCELQCRNVRLSAHQKRSLAGSKLFAVIQRLKGKKRRSFHASLIVWQGSYWTCSSCFSIFFVGPNFSSFRWVQDRKRSITIL